MNTLEALAQLISTTPPIDQPLALGRSRIALIDTLACAVYGSTQPVAVRTWQGAQGWGQGPATVIGRSTSLSLPAAALVNGAAAQAADYDDFDRPANAHPSAVIFPALLSLVANRPVSGRALLDAHIVGVEVMQRLGEAMNMAHYRRGWHSTLTLGTLGAAAACARLQGADRAGAIAALSLAGSMASGLNNQGGFLAKPLHAGLAAQNGVQAVTLAAAGITGSAAVLDGRPSLATTMGDYDPARFAAARAKLGRPWSIVEYGLILKPYPTCGYAQRVVDGAITLHPQLAPATIRAITIAVPDYYLDLLVYSVPATAPQAMLSLPYAVAYALVHGDFDLAALEPAALQDATLHRLCRLATVLPHSPRDGTILYDPQDPDRVTVTLGDGTTLTSAIAYGTGCPAKPLSMGRLRAKFTACVAHHGGIDADPLWTTLNQVEHLPDVTALLHSLAAPAADRD